MRTPERGAHSTILPIISRQLAADTWGHESLPLRSGFNSPAQRFTRGGGDSNTQSKLKLVV
jgi:hypothetical protein